MPKTEVSLFCPDGGYKGGSDAIWLANFAQSCVSEKGCFVDLGIGCGTASFAFLQNCPQWQGLGIDFDADLISASRENIQRLHLESRLEVSLIDISDPSSLQAVKKKFDLVLANPPWHLEGQGRLPSSLIRKRALFGTSITLPLFAKAAAFLLKKGGHFACIVGSSRLADCCLALHQAHLTPRRMQVIYPSPKSPASFILLESSQERYFKAGLLTIEAPLITMPQRSL